MFAINTAVVNFYRTDVLQLCQTALSNPFSSLQPEDTAVRVCLLLLLSRHTILNVTKQDACRKATLASVLHQADQILRQCVSARLKLLRGVRYR